MPSLGVTFVFSAIASCPASAISFSASGARFSQSTSFCSSVKRSRIFLAIALRYVRKRAGLLRFSQSACVRTASNCGPVSPKIFICWVKSVSPASPLAIDRAFSTAWDSAAANLAISEGSAPSMTKPRALAKSGAAASSAFIRFRESSSNSAYRSFVRVSSPYARWNKAVITRRINDWLARPSGVKYFVRFPALITSLAKLVTKSWLESADRLAGASSGMESDPNIAGVSLSASTLASSSTVIPWDFGSFAPRANATRSVPVNRSLARNGRDIPAITSGSMPKASALSMRYCLYSSAETIPSRYAKSTIKYRPFPDSTRRSAPTTGAPPSTVVSLPSSSGFIWPALAETHWRSVFDPRSRGCNSSGYTSRFSLNSASWEGMKSSISRTTYCVSTFCSPSGVKTGTVFPRFGPGVGERVSSYRLKSDTLDFASAVRLSDNASRIRSAACFGCDGASSINPFCAAKVRSSWARPFTNSSYSGISFSCRTCVRRASTAFRTRTSISAGSTASSPAAATSSATCRSSTDRVAR